MQALALTFTTAFASLRPQLLGLVGSQGILPLSEHVSKLEDQLRWCACKGGDLARRHGALNARLQILLLRLQLWVWRCRPSSSSSSGAGTSRARDQASTRQAVAGDRRLLAVCDAGAAASVLLFLSPLDPAALLGTTETATWLSRGFFILRAAQPLLLVACLVRVEAMGCQVYCGGGGGVVLDLVVVVVAHLLQLRLRLCRCLCRCPCRCR